MCTKSSVCVCMRVRVCVCVLVVDVDAGVGVGVRLRQYCVARRRAIVCINFVGGAIVCIHVSVCDVQEEPVILCMCVRVCTCVVNVNGFAFCHLLFSAHCAAPAG